jgi:hypothetical protein
MPNNQAQEPLIALYAAERATDEPANVPSVGEVLRAWRKAERALAILAPGTPDWVRTLDEIDLLRSRYQELFRSVEPPSGSL